MSSHKSIFKTSLITGGSQVMVMMMNMVRAKALAILLGPAGTGIIGLYSTTTDLINTIAGLGLTSSAVKQIAIANSEADRSSIQKTLFVFRWLIRLTTITAALCMFIFAGYISLHTFGSENNKQGIQWMSLVVFFTGISNGQFALLQGLRRIKDLATARVLGALAGSIICITLIFFFRKEGIVPFLIAGAATTVLLSWSFAQKEKITTIKVDFTEFKKRSVELISMGLAFLFSGLSISISAYYSRILISKSFSIHDLGLYTASWTLSAMYVNFILTAMGADFYPRLSGVIEDHDKANKIVNEQTEIGIAMAVTGIVGVISFSAIILRAFYSIQFADAWRLLQWMTAGMAIKVISWPLGFIVVSKGKAKLFALLEISWGFIYIILLYFFTQWMGLEGAGVAFFITYLINWVFVWFSARHLTHFNWNIAVRKQILWMVAAIVLVFISSRLLTDLWSNIFNGLIIILVFWFTYRKLETILGGNFINLLIKKTGLKKNGQH
ncbi:MAG: O-antigen translocase [Ferruginibacter sp.]